MRIEESSGSPQMWAHGTRRQDRIIEQLPDMRESTTSERIERKYVLPDFLLDDAITELKRIIPIYRYNGSSDWSSIRTTYLDTYNLQCYQEYLQKLPVRKKIRIRQYGCKRIFDNMCWVELKVKHHRRSLKRRFRCLKSELTMLMQKKNVRKRIIRYNDVKAAYIYDMIYVMIHEQQLTPAVQVQYERLAFQPSGRNDLRITLDRNVRFRCPQRIHQAPLQGIVLEIKYNGQMPEWMSELQEILGLRRIKRFSKFARSIRRLTELREIKELL